MLSDNFVSVFRIERKIEGKKSYFIFGRASHWNPFEAEALLFLETSEEEGMGRERS